MCILHYPFKEGYFCKYYIFKEGYFCKKTSRVLLSKSNQILIYDQNFKIDFKISFN